MLLVAPGCVGGEVVTLRPDKRYRCTQHEHTHRDMGTVETSVKPLSAFPFSFTVLDQWQSNDGVIEVGPEFLWKRVLALAVLWGWEYAGIRE